MSYRRSGFGIGLNLTLAAAAAVIIASAAWAHEETQPAPAAGKAEAERSVAADEPEAREHVGVRLVMPMMNSERGMRLFAGMGCVACHAVNGVGGHRARNLDAHTMEPVMNPFDFAAKMWAMAPIMIEAQEEAVGHQFLFTGEELADIVAFAHDDEQQRKFTEADIPPEIKEMMSHLHGEPAHQEEHEHVEVHLAMPMMNSERGMRLFATKGCVTCHSINGVGGHDVANLDAHTMEPVMNPFDFFAKMWAMAPIMIEAQEEAAGHQFLFTGDELADIIAFVHDDERQHEFTEALIPPEIMKMMYHIHGVEPAHQEELDHDHGD